jgi:hypothetical protein
LRHIAAGAFSVPGAVGTVAVLEAGHPHRHALVPLVGEGHPLRVELLPAILVVGLARVGVVFGQVRLVRLLVAIDASRRREEVARHAPGRRGVAHVGVDQQAVVEDLALVGVDEAHAAHVRGELIHLVDGLAVDENGLDAALRLTEVELQELVGGGRAELVLLDVHPADPEALLLQPLDQVTSDESPGTADNRSLHGRLSPSFSSARSPGHRNVSHPTVRSIP